SCQPINQQRSPENLNPSRFLQSDFQRWNCLDHWSRKERPDSGGSLQRQGTGVNTCRPKPRFLTAGAGSMWTLNQGDGTVSRVDEKSRKLIATIPVGVPGTGGDIGYGADSVWPTVFDVPLCRIDARANRVVRQWIGNGGDSVRFGFD